MRDQDQVVEIPRSRVWETAAQPASRTCGADTLCARKTEIRTNSLRFLASDPESSRLQWGEGGSATISGIGVVPGQRGQYKFTKRSDQAPCDRVGGHPPENACPGNGDFRWSWSFVEADFHLSPDRRQLGIAYPNGRNGPVPVHSPVLSNPKHFRRCKVNDGSRADQELLLIRCSDASRLRAGKAPDRHPACVSR